MKLAAVLLALSLATPALAVTPDEILKDPQLESRARALSKELRCMVCQNQSIDDSDAPLARDLRLLVRERLTAGDSDTQVLTFLRERYGAFVLLRPPLDAGTILLWATPLLVLLAGGVAIVWTRRRKATSGGMALASLSEAEERQLARLTASSTDEKAGTNITKD